MSANINVIRLLATSSTSCWAEAAARAASHLSQHWDAVRPVVRIKAHFIRYETGGEVYY